MRCKMQGLYLLLPVLTACTIRVPDALDVTCGNGTIDQGEQCDGRVDNQTCTTIGRGFTGGTLSCQATTCQWDTSNCTGNTGNNSTCGNGVIDGSDVCDGAQLNGKTCATIGRGFTGGTLSCQALTCQWDTSNCTGSNSTCGNGVIEGSEVCDGAQLNGRTCATIGRGFTGGTLSCQALTCQWDTSNCLTETVACSDSNQCGDGKMCSTDKCTAETFDLSNKPKGSQSTIIATNNSFIAPWNYEKDYNKNKKYPLLIVFNFDARYLGLAYSMGYSPSPSPQDTYEDFQSQHPSFILFFYADYNSQMLDDIETLKNNFRIDENRIYVIGHSKGGNFTYFLANGYCSSKGSYIAGIIRLAGQDTTALADSVAQKTSVWLGIGLSDTQTRIDVIHAEYGKLKSKHPTASESTETYDVAATANTTEAPGYTATTLTLTENSSTVVKMSDFKSLEHMQQPAVLRDRRLMDWLYSKKVQQ